MFVKNFGTKLIFLNDHTFRSKLSTKHVQRCNLQTLGRKRKVNGLHEIEPSMFLKEAPTMASDLSSWKDDPLCSWKMTRHDLLLLETRSYVMMPLGILLILRLCDYLFKLYYAHMAMMIYTPHHEKMSISPQLHAKLKSIIHCDNNHNLH